MIFVVGLRGDNGELLVDLATAFDSGPDFAFQLRLLRSLHRRLTSAASHGKRRKRRAPHHLIAASHGKRRKRGASQQLQLLHSKST